MRTVPARSVLGSLVLALTVSALAACGSHDRSGVSPERTLAAAKKNLDGTSGVRIGLSTPRLPAGVNGLLGADGIGTHAPAFTGAIKVSASGVTADAAVVAVRHAVYARLPFTSKFVRIDPSRYGAPDPAALMGAHGGLSSLLTSATHVQEGGKVRAGSEVLSSYTATVPGKAVSAVIPSATSTAGFRAVFTVDDKGRLAKAVLTGPFYPHAKDVTYTITFADYGTAKRIVAP